MTIFMITAGFNTTALLLWGNDDVVPAWVKVSLACLATLGWAHAFALALA